MLLVTLEALNLSYSNRSRISSFLVDTRNSEISHSSSSRMRYLEFLTTFETLNTVRDLSASRYTRSTESLTSHSLLRSLPALDISLPRRFEIRAKALISHRRERYLELEALSLAYGLIHAMLLTDVRSISYRINFSLTLEAYANQASSHSS